MLTDVKLILLYFITLTLSLISADWAFSWYDAEHWRGLSGGRTSYLRWCPPLCHQERVSDSANTLSRQPAVATARKICTHIYTHWICSCVTITPQIQQEPDFEWKRLTDDCFHYGLIYQSTLYNHTWHLFILLIY